MTDTAEHLIYPGMINALNGQPGGGKTWVALHTCAEAIKQGLHVMFIGLKNPIREGQKVPLTLSVKGPDGKRRSIGVEAEARRTSVH